MSLYIFCQPIVRKPLGKRAQPVIFRPHLKISALFKKSSVAFEAQNIRVKSITIQVEFEIKRSSTTTFLAVAGASIASDRSRSDGDGGMR
jgi:hypothetical protein